MEDSLGLTGRGLLDRYEVGAAIAHGGMAIIYEGRDQRLFRPVCVKVFHRLRPSEAAYKTAYEHFVQEAFALSQFSHPNTLRIYDFGYLEGDVAAPFFVSELLEGGTLSQLVRRHGPLAPGDAREILEPVAGALAEAHAQNIVHRDIKPSNILFGLAGGRRIVKLCDFGIAKVVDVTCGLGLDGHGDDDDASGPSWRAADTHLRAGMPLRLYSPGWASPEQVRGDLVGPAADIYSLGLLSAYVLTGRTLLGSRPAVSELFDDHHEPDLDAEIDRALAASTIPAPLADLIRRACRVRVEDRIATADEFAQALRRAVRDCARERGTLETEPFRRATEGDALSLPLPPGDDAPAPALPPAPGPGPGMTSSHSVTSAIEVIELDSVDLLSAPPPPVAPHPLSIARAAVEATILATGTVPEPAPTAPVAQLRVDPDGKDEVLVAGRRMRLLAMSPDYPLDLGGDGPMAAVRSPARFRVTLMPSKTTAPRINMRGLNCFLLRSGARPSTAIDVEADMDVDLIAPDRRALDHLRCSVGRAGDGTRLYDLGPVTIEVPAGAGAVMLDFGPGRDLALIHRGAPNPARRRR